MATTGWGGARSGAGRPRTVLTFKLPPEIVEQLEEIAETEHARLVDVVAEALLKFIERWQVEHDSTSTES